MKSKPIAYVAVLSALAMATILLVYFVLPASIVPLAVVSAVGLVTFYLVGWKGGIAFIVVVELLSFVFTGLSITFFSVTVLFIPYIIYAYAIRKLSYTQGVGKAIIRIIATLAYFYLTSLALILILIGLGKTSGSGFTLLEAMDKVGVYIAPLLFALVALSSDFFISTLAVIAVDKINKNTKGKKQ